MFSHCFDSRISFATYNNFNLKFTPQVLLRSRPLYNAAVRLFNKKFASYVREHDLEEVFIHFYKIILFPV